MDNLSHTSRGQYLGSVFLLVSMITIVAFLAYHNIPHPYLGKSNIPYVYNNADELFGKKIAIIGFAHPLIIVRSDSLSGRCGGELDSVKTLLTQSPDSKFQNPEPHFIESVEISILHCTGQPCNYSCIPIQIRDGELYSFEGFLQKNTRKNSNVSSLFSELMLTEIDLDHSWIWNKGAWHSIPRGSVTTIIFVLDPKTGEQIYPSK